VTRLLVEALGGTMAFESTEGTGSRFTVTLPLAAPAVVAGPGQKNALRVVAA
jgi:signal transduction histidine kinase